MVFKGWEAIFFYLLAFAAILFASLTITARNAVHSALFLISTLITVAGLFILLQAEFIAGVQILVYVGGVMVLFLFVIMLVNVREEKTHIYTGQFGMGIMVVFLLSVSMIVVLIQTQRANFFNTGIKLGVEIKRDPVTGEFPTVANPEDLNQPVDNASPQNSEKIGRELYIRGALPFEIASLILLVAIIGAVRMARERKQEQLYD